MFKILSILMLLGATSVAAQENQKIQLNSANTVVYRGEVSANSATAVAVDLLRQVAKRGTKDYPIYLVLDSPGGSIEAGFMFIQLVKHVPNLHTISIFSASMASAIVEALPGQRMVTENGTLMFHKAYAGMEGTVETGSLETRLYYVKRRVLKLENSNAARMTTSLEDYKRIINNELWLDSDDSLRYRAADKVVDLVCTAELIAKMTEVRVMSIFGQASFAFSGCPLFRVPFEQSGEEKVKYNFGPSAVSIK